MRTSQIVWLASLAILGLASMGCGNNTPLGHLTTPIQDADRDGVPDDRDECPGFNDSLDSDQDGVADGCDLCPGFDDALDADGDGRPDGCDSCALFDLGIDTDGDSVVDECDLCEGSPDSQDRDGDGVPDGCDACDAGSVDVVLALDTSGSMLGILKPVLSSLLNYVGAFSGNDVNFAVVDFSYFTEPYVRRMMDFSDNNTVSERLAAMTANGGGNEAALDALYFVCESVNRLTLSLAWRTGAQRVVFLFTDEPAQSHEMPAITSSDVENSCFANDITIHTWTSTDTTFAAISAATGGVQHAISGNQTILLNQLTGIAVNLCTL